MAATKRPQFESIRVVPLHHPKPVIALEDLGKETGESELFTGKPHKLAAPPKLIYNGGPLITSVKVYTIFWGTLWKANSSYISLISKINDFFKTILTSSLIDQLGEYNRPGKVIGHGKLIGSKVITAASPGAVIHDSQIQTALSGWIAKGAVPTWDANTLYFIYLPTGVKVTMGGASSCSSFCGYHNDIKKKKFYAVMPFPSCAGCLGGATVFNALTATSSHELCEAITDPVPGTGWYDNNNGEIGDICAWQFKTVAGYHVQLEWSNKASACI